MTTTVNEIAPGVHRLSTFHPEFGIQFNQFLVVDDEPFLMHTGMRRMFAATRDAVARVIDPARLRWLGFSHFESDGGALNEWLRLAPEAQPVWSFVGATVTVDGGRALLDLAAVIAEVLGSSGAATPLR